MTPRSLVQNQKILPHAYYRILESYLTYKRFHVKFREVTILRESWGAVPQGIVLGLVPYILYARDLLTSDNTTTATFADIIQILATHEHPEASTKLKATINKFDDWAKKWKIIINQIKCKLFTFTLRNQNYPTVQMGNVDLPQKNEGKCLGMQLDRRLTWANHIKYKRKQLNLKAKQMNWLLERSKLWTGNKLLL
jgi:hypothetical protein